MGLLKTLRDRQSAKSGVMDEMESDRRIPEITDGLPDTLQGNYTRLEAAAYLCACPEKSAELGRLCSEYAEKFKTEAGGSEARDERDFGTISAPMESTRKLQAYQKGMAEAAAAANMRASGMPTSGLERLLDKFEYMEDKYEIYCAAGTVQALDRYLSHKEHTTKTIEKWRWNDIEYVDRNVSHDEYTKFVLANNGEGKEFHFPRVLPDISINNAMYVFSLTRRTKNNKMDRQFLAIYNDTKEKYCYFREFRCSGLFVWLGIGALVGSYMAGAWMKNLSVAEDFGLLVFGVCASCLMFWLYSRKRKLDRFLNRKCSSVIKVFLKMSGALPLTMATRDGKKIYL